MWSAVVVALVSENGGYKFGLVVGVYDFELVCLGLRWFWSRMVVVEE